MDIFNQNIYEDITTENFYSIHILFSCHKRILLLYYIRYLCVKDDTYTLGLSFLFQNVLMLLGKSKEAEIKRINKELANIRSKFKGDKTLDGYQKKKYVCKLLFIFLLGHDIDFGHMEAVNLLSSNKYSEKQIVSKTIGLAICNIYNNVRLTHIILGISFHIGPSEH